MKKKYIQPSAEFEEIEESLLYEPSILNQDTTPENHTQGPETGTDIGDDDDDWDW